MKRLGLSIAVKRGISSVIVTSEGMVLAKRVYSLPSEFKDKSTNTKLIETLKSGLILVKGFVDASKDDCNLVIECNNSILINWVKKGMSTDAYIEPFFDMMNVLHQLPAVIDFHYTQHPKALMFATADNLTVSKLSGLLD